MIREENVKLDVFGVFIDVLKQTTLVSRGSRNTNEGVLALLQTNVHYYGLSYAANSH